MPDRTTDKINAIIEASRADVLDALGHSFAWSLERCESPIEKLLAAAFVAPAACREFDTRLELLNPPSGKIEHCQAPPIDGVFMWQQISIGPYRVDFLLDSYPGRNLRPLVVECDGHDFHERTKEQAQRDKARDRFLVGRGYRVLRFTGSEIFADAEEAAHQALKILLGLAD